jgi:hypothetical protein
MRGAVLCALFVSAACASSPTAPSSTVSSAPSPSPPPTLNVGTGVVSVGVRAGEQYTVLVGAPVHMPPAQRYEVKTFIAGGPDGVCSIRRCVAF